jgi:uncharacterized protein (DUF2235 family)
VAKNIILLADGTGNGASSPFKTNVWRLYQALDICAPSPGGLEQVVFYDDGVGTEAFKPLQLLPRLWYRRRAQRQEPLHVLVPKLQTRRQYLSVRI